MFAVIVYDISNDKKRSKIAKILLSYGDRVQKSVFECDLSDRQIEDLRKKLEAFEYESEDTIRMYFLELSSLKRTETIGFKSKISVNKDFYLV